MMIRPLGLDLAVTSANTYRSMTLPSLKADEVLIGKRCTRVLVDLVFLSTSSVLKFLSTSYVLKVLQLIHLPRQ